MKLPVSLPDELLLSRLIRYVTVSSDKGDNFSSKVFGSRKVSIHPFLTARLEQLAGWGLESAEVMLFQQTLAPLFLFFLPTYADRLKEGANKRGNSSRLTQSFHFFSLSRSFLP